jgi:stearoyl-CoA desaturase (delta-9 desaturase)
MPAPDLDPGVDRVDWARTVPFLALHVACLAALWTGVSPVALAVCGLLYLVRMFGITAGFHRYFSHRAFRASRPVAFLLAILGGSAAQRSALWWAAHHRAHHRHSEQGDDLHSPTRHGLFWSHVGWILTRRAFPARMDLIPDLARRPELRFLHRFDILPPALLGLATWGLGAALARYAPELGTGGPQMFVWGFLISTVLLFHATFTINSLAHSWGTRRFDTPDESRNNALLAALTLGEGWHNNHHHYPHSSRQGFRRWELDPTHAALTVLSWMGLVSDLRPVPPELTGSPRVYAPDAPTADAPDSEGLS